MPFLTAEEVATWARRDVATFGAFETMVIDNAQELVADEAAHIEWLTTTDPTTVPFRARMIALNLAKRTITNPDMVVAEGSIGPIGGDRFLEEAALAMELSEAEKDELQKLQGDGTTAPGLWVQPTNADRTLDTVAFVSDDSLSDWMIPFGTTGDVGEPDSTGTF